MSFQKKESHAHRRMICAVRLRPPSDQGKPDGLFNFGSSTRGIINIHNPNDKDPRQIHDREFLFDSVEDWTSSQEDFHQNQIKPVVESVVSGINFSIFVGGQQKAGKTHTLLGGSGVMAGIIPRTLDLLFAIAKERHALRRKFNIFISAHENYCEVLRNTGCQHKSKTTLDSLPVLEMRGDEVGGFELEGLTTSSVSSTAEAMHILTTGRATRHRVFSEGYNPHSIAVVTLVIAQSDPERGLVTSKLHFIELASPERAAPAARERENAVVVKTLDVVSQVLGSLSTVNADRSAPYSESKLTKYLHDSLIGTGRALLIACLDPIPSAYEDNYATLTYANKCRNGKAAEADTKDVSDPVKNAKYMDKLTGEVFSLKEQLQAAHDYYQRKLADMKQSQQTAEQRPSSAPNDPRPPSGVNAKRDVGDGGAGGGGGGGGDSDTVTSNNNDNQAMAAYLVRQHNAEVRELKDKLNKRGLELRELRDSFGQTQTQLRTQAEQQKQRANGLQLDMKELRQNYEDRIAALEEKHERELELLRQNNSRVVSQLTQQIESVPETLKQTTSVTKNYISESASLKSQLQSHYADVVKEMDATREKALHEQKEQFEFWLEKKSNEMRAMVKQYNTYKQTKEDELNTLQQQLDIIFSYSQSLASIVENYEKGLYAVYDKSGVKCVHIPPSHKPGPLPETAMRALKKFRSQTEELLVTNGMMQQQQHQQQIQLLKQQLQRSATPQADPSGSDMMRGQRARDRDRQKLEEEILNDLADHPTIEYIKQLEAERDYYKSQLSEEVQANRHAKISLDSKERQIQKLRSVSGSVGMSGRSTSLSMISLGHQLSQTQNRSSSRLSRPHTQMS